MSTYLAWLARGALGRLLPLLGALACVALTPARVQAGGLYLAPRGAQPFAMAGARVAGARGVHALWYNPAGLVMGRPPGPKLSGDRELLVDLTLPLARASFARRIEQDDGSFSREPRAEARSLPVPIPTLGYTDSLGLRQFGFGVALLAPVGTSFDWPSEVNGQRAPQRYSVLDTRGTALGSLVLGAAYRPIEQLAFGAALSFTAAQVGGTVAVSACDYAVCQLPEGREWEGRTRFLLGPVYTASATFGAIYDGGIVKVGLSGQLRTTLSGEARFDVTLPDQSFFDGVRVQNGAGDDDLRAAMKVVLPGVARLGIAATPLTGLELELASTWERWSVQDAIRIVPKDVFVQNVPTLGTVRAQPVTLARHMRDTWSLALGARLDLGRFGWRRVTLQGGSMFESSAFADRDLNPTTLDARKLLLALGASVDLGRGVALDLSYGHLFMDNRRVRDSRVLLPSAIRPTPDDRPAIANGDYTLEADVIAAGVRIQVPRPGT